jgi:hypothetical protein
MYFFFQSFLASFNNARDSHKFRVLKKVAYRRFSDSSYQVSLERNTIVYQMKKSQVAKPKSIFVMDVTHQNLLWLLLEKDDDDDEILLAPFIRENKCTKFEIERFIIYINKQPVG